MEGADGRLTDTHGCAKTHPAPPNDPICWRVASAAALGGGSWPGAKVTGHRLWNQFVDSVRLTFTCSTRTLSCSSSTSSGLEVSKNFSKTGNAAGGKWKRNEGKPPPAKQRNIPCVLIDNPEGKRLFMFMFHLSGSGLFFSALKWVFFFNYFFIFIFFCSDFAVRWGQGKYEQISVLSD